MSEEELKHVLKCLHFSKPFEKLRPPTPSLTEGVRLLSLTSVVTFLQARGTYWTTIPVTCLRISDWPISIHNWLYIVQRVLSDPYSDALSSEECQTTKLLVNMQRKEVLPASMKGVW